MSRRNCLECTHWKACYNGKEWDAKIGDTCDYFDGSPEKDAFWELTVRSFYRDNYDESTELCVYIVANCSNCGRKHPDSHQIYSASVYPPEDATDDFRFDQEYEERKHKKKFLSQNPKFANYCPECGKHMSIEVNYEE